jgi:hypothetical protein
MPFIRELISNKKEQLDFYSAQFSVVRWLQMVVTVLLLTLLVFTGRALLHVSYRYVKLQHTYDELNAESIIRQSKIEELEQQITACKTRGRSSKTDP